MALASVTLLPGSLQQTFLELHTCFLPFLVYMYFCEILCMISNHHVDHRFCMWSPECIDSSLARCWGRGCSLQHSLNFSVYLTASIIPNLNSPQNYWNSFLYCFSAPLIDTLDYNRLKTVYPTPKDLRVQYTWVVPGLAQKFMTCGWDFLSFQSLWCCRVISFVPCSNHPLQHLVYNTDVTPAFLYCFFVSLNARTFLLIFVPAHFMSLICSIIFGLTRKHSLTF